MKQLLIIHSYFSPADNLKQIYLDFVTSAKETIRIVDYSFNMVELVDLLNKKQKEGVDVMLILDKSQEGGKSEKVALSKLDKNITVLFGESSKGKIIHDKFTIIDGKAVESGSWNYTEVAGLEDNQIDIIYSRKRALEFTKIFVHIYTRLNHSAKVPYYGEVWHLKSLNVKGLK